MQRSHAIAFYITRICMRNNAVRPMRRCPITTPAIYYYRVIARVVLHESPSTSAHESAILFTQSPNSSVVVVYELQFGEQEHELTKT